MALIEYFLPFLLFIPGSVLLHLFSLKYKLGLSKLEEIILGCTFWNFLLVSFGCLIGIFSSLITRFFVFFFSFSSAILLYGSYYMIETKKLPKIRLEISLDKLLLTSFVGIVLMFIFTLTVTHSIFIEYDAIFLYLPLAKSIIKTGNLQYDYYHQTNLTTASQPAMPIIYSWLNYFCESWVNFNLVLRIIPFVYTILTSISIYLITKEISNNSTSAIIALLCFLSMPITSAIASNYSLYLDIPFTFLLTLSLFILLKIHSKQENNNFWLLMLGITASFMLLEKDLSFFILPELIVILLIPIFLSFSKKSQIVLAIPTSIIFTSVYNFLFAWDLYHFPGDMRMGFIIKQFPVFITTVIFLILIIKLPNNENQLIQKKSLLFFSLPFIPVILYIIRNAVFLEQSHQTSFSLMRMLEQLEH